MTAVLLPLRLPCGMLHLPLGLVPLALLLPAALLDIALDLSALSLLLLLQLLPGPEEPLHLAAEGGLVDAHGRSWVRGLCIRSFDLLPHVLDLFLGDGLIRTVQPFLEVLLCSGQLSIPEFVVVRQGPDR
jgi:hypothetical protein